MKDLFSTKWIISCILAGMLLTVVSLYTCAQTVCKLDSAVKVKGTVWKVWVVQDSCTGYVLLYNSHCWKCKEDQLPKEYYVTNNNEGNYFIKPKTK